MKASVLIKFIASQISEYGDLECFTVADDNVNRSIEKIGTVVEGERGQEVPKYFIID